MVTNQRSDISRFLDYEIRSSWWASYIWWDWGSKLASSYFAWKVRTKYTRYRKSIQMGEELRAKGYLSKKDLMGD